VNSQPHTRSAVEKAGCSSTDRCEYARWYSTDTTHTLSWRKANIARRSPISGRSTPVPARIAASRAAVIASGAKLMRW
jgi:hypothetical protein